MSIMIRKHMSWSDVGILLALVLLLATSVAGVIGALLVIWWVAAEIPMLIWAVLSGVAWGFIAGVVVARHGGL